MHSVCDTIEISFCICLLDYGVNERIQRDFEIKLHHMSSVCIQCMMRSHDRKHDYFLTLLILNIQVQKGKEKLNLSTVTEWSNTQFKFK